MNSILILGSLWIYATIYFMLLTLFYVLKCVTDNKQRRKKYRQCFKLKQKLNRVLFFKTFISLFVEGYFEFVISIFMNLRDPYPFYNKNGELIGWISAQLFCVVIFVFLPILTMYVICAKKKTLRHPKFKTRFDILIEDMRPKSTWSKMYFFLF